MKVLFLSVQVNVSDCSYLEMYDWYSDLYVTRACLTRSWRWPSNWGATLHWIRTRHVLYPKEKSHFHTPNDNLPILCLNFYDYEIYEYSIFNNIQKYYNIVLKYWVEFFKKNYLF